MKKKSIFIVAGIIIISSVLGTVMLTSTTEKNEFYELSVQELKEEYPINGKVKFSVILSGYGGACGTFEIDVEKNEKKLPQLANFILDCTGSTMEKFSFNLSDNNFIKDFIPNESGTYLLKIRFDPTFGNTPTVYLEKTFEVVEN